VLEGIEPGGQLTTTTDVENYPGFENGVQGPELMDIMHKQAERFGARYQLATVTGVDFSKSPFRVTVDEEDTLEAQSVIIATGASAKYLGLESEKKLLGQGVSSCATCDGAFFRDVPVAVVGGGDTAMEEALFLTRFASKVTIIHRRDAFRASKIMAERALKNDKIDVIWNSVVEEVHDPEKGEVTGLTIRDVESGEQSEVEVNGFFVAIGHQPNTDPFQGQIKMDDRGYIVARNTKTDVEGVFAAGDVQDAVYRQAVTAAGSGCMAAMEAERYLEARDV